MSTEIQRRRGTTAQHATFTGAAGELTVDTDKNTVVVHDGATAGGHPLANVSLLAEYIVTGSAVTSIDFTGLDINTHKSYRIEIELINATASASTISMFINNDTTSTNYYDQYRQGDGAAINAARANDAAVAGLDASDRLKINIALQFDGSYAHADSRIMRGTGAVVQSLTRALSYNVSIANITQLTFTSSVASCLAVGSKIRIYRGDV